MNKDDMIILNAYPNTEERENILVNCIKQLKKLDIDICLVSHFQIKPYIQEMVDYYVYDKRNLFIPFAFNYNHPNIELSTLEFLNNASVAVLISLQNGFNTARCLNKKRVHYFEYDCLIDDKDFDTFNNIKDELISQNKNGFIQIDTHGEYKGINTLFFSIDVDYFFSNFPIVNDINDFYLNLKDITIPCLEVYMYKFIMKDIDSFIINEQKSIYDLFVNSNLHLSTMDKSFIDILPDINSKKPVFVIIGKDTDTNSKTYKINFIKNNETDIQTVTVHPNGYYYNILSDDVKYIKVYVNDQLVFDRDKSVNNKTKHEYIKLK